MQQTTFRRVWLLIFVRFSRVGFAFFLLTIYIGVRPPVVPGQNYLFASLSQINTKCNDMNMDLFQHVLHKLNVHNDLQFVNLKGVQNINAKNRLHTTKILSDFSPYKPEAVSF